MEKTIKELADELGFNKDKVKYQARKLPSELTSKKNGITYINEKGQNIIGKQLIGKEVGKKAGNLPSKNKELPSELPSDYLLEQLKIKDQEIESKNNQINRMLDSNDKLQKLLDQQQILTLQANKKIEQLETELEKEDEPDRSKEEKAEELKKTNEKKGFWQKFFSK